VEHFWLNTPLVHNGRGALAFRHCETGGDYRLTTSPTADGKLFLEDVISNRVILNGPIKLWARQLNIEFGPTDALFQNFGGKAWLFGYKTEGEQTTVLNDVGATTEVLGGYFYALRNPGNTPMLINRGAFSVSFRNGGGTPFRTAVEETKNGQTKTASSDQVGYSAALYVGY
jgi:hypothetical protein